MQSRHDPRVEPDDPPTSDELETGGSHSQGTKPESAKRVTGAPPARPSFDPRVDPAGLGETSDLVELPVEPPSRQRPPAPESPSRQRATSADPPLSRHGSQTGSRASFEGSPPTRRASGNHVVTNVDPRLEQIEPIIDDGNWHTVGKQLGSLEDSGRLPPTLGLVA